MVHRRVQKHKSTSSNSQEIQDKPLIRKSKQIQTTKGKSPTHHQILDPPGEPSFRR